MPELHRGSVPLCTPAAAQAPAAGAFLPAKFGSFNFLSYLCTETSKRREKNKPQQSQTNRQLVYEHQQTEVSAKEKNDNLIQLGKFFYSLAGMTYAGAVLTFIVDFNEDNTLALLTALVSLVLLASVGWLFVKRGNIKK